MTRRQGAWTFFWAYVVVALVASLTWNPRLAAAAAVLIAVAWTLALLSDGRPLD